MINRTTPLWKALHKCLSEERHARYLIEALENINEKLDLSPSELTCVQSACDMSLLYKSAGYLIRGEDTEHTRTFCDVLYRYWSHIEKTLPIEEQVYISNKIDNI